MEIADAAKGPQGRLVRLLKLGLAAARDKPAGRELDPVVVGSAASLEKFLLAQGRGSGRRRRVGLGRQSGDTAAPTAINAVPRHRIRSFWNGFLDFIGVRVAGSKPQGRADPRAVNRLMTAGRPARAFAKRKSVVGAADENADRPPTC